MTDKHTNFIDRLVDSKPAVIKVADFIKKKGYQVTIPETKIAPAPELGSSNNYILHDLLGIEQTSIDKMVEEQIIY